MGGDPRDSALKAVRARVYNAWMLNLRIYAILKMINESIQFLNENYDQCKKAQSTFYLSLKSMRIFDFLRSDPRFHEIMAKHKKLYEQNLKKYGDSDL
jgi:hypothetical protein